MAPPTLSPNHEDFPTQGSIRFSPPCQTRVRRYGGNREIRRRRRKRDSRSWPIPASPLRRSSVFDRRTCAGIQPQSSYQDARKGKGTKGQTIPLTPSGLAALRRFDELECWGPFSTSPMWQSFQRACSTLGLTGLRPYDFRHSFGTAVYAASGDLRATQQLLGHASRTTTDRYTLAAVPERLRIAVGQTEKLLNDKRNVAVPCGSTTPVLVNSRK